MRKFVLGLILISLLVSIIVLTCSFLISKGETKELKEVTVKLKWLHQAQFAGIYTAIEKEFYKKEGLRINLIPFSFEKPTIQSVVNNEADFGITGADELILARAKGFPLKAIAVIYKINPVCAYALKESGIKTPYDFIGKTIGLERGTNVDLLYFAMMKKLKIDRKKIKEISIRYDASELIKGITDVSTGYIINEPHQAIEAGYEVNTILMADYGINIYADVLFTRDELIDQQPKLVEKFLRATLKGWQYAIEHELEAVNHTLKYSTDTTLSHQLYMLTTSIPLIHTGDNPLGMMKKEEWEKVQNLLIEQNLLKDPIDIEQVFTLEFLEKIYGKDKIL